MENLLTESYFALFLIIALGILFGHVKIKGVSLDISAVIFVALVLGHLGMMVPEVFSKLGVLLFIFTIGIQAGPGFFDSFRKKGLQIIAAVVVMMLSAVLATVLLGYLLKIDFKIGVGLFAGALTSTPGLAAAIESSHSPIASIGYGIAYPFGVLGVILFVRLLPRSLKTDIQKSEQQYNAETLGKFPKIFNANFRVENINADNKTLAELQIKTMTGATISRVMHDNAAVTPTPGTIVRLGDYIKAVGSEEELDRVKIIIGGKTDIDIPLSTGYDVQWILVTNKKVVNKTVGELNLHRNYNANVTRIRRSGIDISPNANSQIRFGDKLMIACDKENMTNVTKLLGNNAGKLSETDFLPIALGIVLGILFGRVNIPVPGGGSFHLGLTGGVLIVALVLSRIGRTGPVVWTMSGSANQVLRTLGLLFFLAAVGTDAGSHFSETFIKYGPKLFLFGAVITLVPLFTGAVIGIKVFRINMLTLLGALTGGMTSTPGLAAVDPMTDCEAPQVAYATVYPVALVCIIICAQVLGRL